MPTVLLSWMQPGLNAGGGFSLHAWTARQDYRIVSFQATVLLGAGGSDARVRLESGGVPLTSEIQLAPVAPGVSRFATPLEVAKAGQKVDIMQTANDAQGSFTDVCFVVELEPLLETNLRR